MNPDPNIITLPWVEIRRECPTLGPNIILYQSSKILIFLNNTTRGYNSQI